MLIKKAIIFYDNVQNLDPFVKERLEDLSQFYNGSVLHDPSWTIIKTYNLHESLWDLVDKDYDFVIVAATGNCIRDGGIDDYIINQCIETNSPLIGHIIAHPDDMIRLDPQFFCLNLKVWDLIGNPIFESRHAPIHLTGKTFTRSEGNYHDDYTPHYVEPSYDIQNYDYGHHPFGSWPILTMIDWGYTIYNVDSTLRKKKYFLYPRSNQDELITLFSNFDSEVNAIPLQHFQKVIKTQRDISDKTVYILNSEKLVDQNLPNIDHFIGVCGGLKPAMILGLNGSTTAKVSLFDFSEIAIEFQKYIKDTWNGDLYIYKDVCAQFQQEHPDNIFAWKSWNTWEHEVDCFLESANLSFTDFRSYWQQYQEMDASFTYVNLLDSSSVSSFIDSIGTDPKTFYVWVSNVFNMEYTTALHGKRYLDEKYEEFEKEISRLNGSVYVEKECFVTKLK